MPTARDEILARVRAAVAPGSSVVAEPVPRDYRRAGGLTQVERLELFTQRVSDYRASVLRVPAAEVASAIARACAERGLRRLAVPPGLPASWRPAGADGLELVEDRGLDARELDGIDAALTGCAVAIAETGTLVLDGDGACGRRLLTLVPDSHICVVGADQVVELVPEALARVEPAVAERRAPLTLISGSSATSDIELERVEGVHGPRNLLVVIAE
jgi:L-lactate dehydrogenase complex protein LldG